MRRATRRSSLIMMSTIRFALAASGIRLRLQRLQAQADRAQRPAQLVRRDRDQSLPVAERVDQPPVFSRRCESPSPGGRRAPARARDRRRCVQFPSFFAKLIAPKRSAPVPIGTLIRERSPSRRISPRVTDARSDGRLDPRILRRPDFQNPRGRRSPDAIDHANVTQNAQCGAPDRLEHRLDFQRDEMTTHVREKHCVAGYDLRRRRPLRPFASVYRPLPHRYMPDRFGVR